MPVVGAVHCIRSGHDVILATSVLEPRIIRHCGPSIIVANPKLANLLWRWRGNVFGREGNNLSGDVWEFGRSGDAVPRGDRTN